jgi:hypothetical protein
MNVMKKQIYRRYLLIVFIALAVSNRTEAAAVLDLDWFTIDGGGGAATGGGFNLTGTIGQFDAGVMTAGAFSLVGGFWSVTMADAPRLRIVASGSNVTISWPDPSTGYVLQQSSRLGASPPWIPVGQSPVAVNGEKQITLARSSTLQFFRLSKP